jgi:hypothetical protein
MVHALHEAHRVLKANGTLIDLRPAAVHRRVGLVHAGGYQHAGTMRELLDDDRAANRAITHVLDSGLYRAEWRTQFECQRVMDSLDDFRLFLAEFITLAKDLPPHDWLLQRVQRALDMARGQVKIVVKGPLVLRVLRKMDMGKPI